MVKHKDITENAEKATEKCEKNNKANMVCFPLTLWLSAEVKATDRDNGGRFERIWSKACMQGTALFFFFFFFFWGGGGHDWLQSIHMLLKLIRLIAVYPHVSETDYLKRQQQNNNKTT